MSDEQVDSVDATHVPSGYWVYVLVLAAPTLCAVLVFKKTAFGDALALCWLYIAFVIGYPICSRRWRSIKDWILSFVAASAILLVWISLMMEQLSAETIEIAKGWGMLSVMLYLVYTEFAKWLLRRFFGIQIKSKV